MTGVRDAMEIDAYASPGFGENAYLVRCRATDRMVVIDPGASASEMVNALAGRGDAVDAVLLTHAHLDHVEGVSAVVKHTGAPVWLHRADAPLYDAVVEQGAMFGLSVEAPPPVDHALEDGQVFEFGECALHVGHAPGHSPGHVILHAPDEGVAFVGDVVFMGSIGRTDLPGGDYQQLMNTIRTRILTLPDDTLLYPGHGPSTTVARERESNPFLIPHFGGGLA